jgi:hypothetical protein
MARSSIKRAGGVIGVAAAVLVGGLTVTASADATKAPAATCFARDGKKCAATTVRTPPPHGAAAAAISTSATVTVVDNDTLAASITQSVSAGRLTCKERGLEPSSDELFFDVVPAAPSSVAGMLTVVSFTAPLKTANNTRVLDPKAYNVCFSAPYDFLALDLRPGQLASDRARNDFSGNTVKVADIGKPDTVTPGYKGILLACDYSNPRIKRASTPGVEQTPCVAGATVDSALGTITITLSLPTLDPFIRIG